VAVTLAVAAVAAVAAAAVPLERPHPALDPQRQSELGSETRHDAVSSRETRP
jgi:hypothetical protein